MTYLIGAICTLLITPFAPWIMKKCGRPNTIIIGGALNLIGFVFFGPIQFLPPEPGFVMSGAALEGFGYPLLFIPTLP